LKKSDGLSLDQILGQSLHLKIKKKAQRLLNVEESQFVVGIELQCDTS